MAVATILPSSSATARLAVSRPASVRCRRRRITSVHRFPYAGPHKRALGHSKAKLVGSGYLPDRDAVGILAAKDTKASVILPDTNSRMARSSSI